MPLSKRLLTNRERILLLLSQYEYDPEEDYMAVPQLSQDGISEALDMRKNNVSRELSKLKEEGLVKERIARVKGFDRRRKIYILTEEGKSAKDSILEELKEKELEKEGEKTFETIEEAVKKLNDRRTEEKVRPFHIEERMRKKDVLNLDDFSIPPQLLGEEREEKIEILRHAPAKKKIFGRSEEMDRLTEKIEQENPPHIVIEGIAGIGKTALGRELLENIRDKRDTLWYNFHPWEDVSSFVEVLNEFCEKSQNEKIDVEASVPEITRELIDITGDSRPVFFLDNCEEMPSKLRPFFEVLMREKKRGKKFSAVMMTRIALGFYEVREELRGNLFRLKLGPLAKEGIREMLGEEEISIDEILDKTGGHPLHVELYEKYGGESVQMNDFIEKEIYSELEKEEKKLLQRLSVFWEPVKKDIVLDKGGTERLIKLKNDNLVEETAEGKIELHNILKDFFYENTSVEEKKELHGLAAERLKDIDNQKKLEILYHLEMAEKALEALEMLGELVPELSQLSGSFREKILDAFPEGELSEEEKGTYHAITADIHFNSKEWEGAVKSYEKAIERKEETARLEEKLAETQMKLERWEDTIQTHKKALSQYREKDDKEGEFRENLSLGTVYRKKGELEKAENFYEKAGSLVEDLEDREEGVAILANNMGMLQISKKNYKKAEDLFKDALKKGGEKPIIYENLSLLFEKVGDLDETVSYLKKAIDRHKRREDHREVIDLLMKCSQYDLKRNEFDSGVENLKEALRLEDELTERSQFLKKREKVSRSKAKIHDKLAQAFREKGNWKRCLTHRKQAIKNYEELDDQEEVAKEKLSYAFDLSDKGDKKRALKILKEVEEASRSLSIHSGITAAHLEKARIYEEKGDYRKAEEILKESIKEGKKRDDERAIEVGEELLKDISNKMGKK
ncbi:MAG: tetratricopeptide repeat protein [Candidatus Thermoplasmatota archaeon]|nr:tetratricopeptide repeat protein [Candidatus Thermoplasmatota archaeon]